MLAETATRFQEVSAKTPEASENAGANEYARGYAEGYEAAKRDMANALNGLQPQLPEIPDDLPF